MIGPFPLIVSNGVLKNSSDVFNILDPDSGGASTFSVKLNASGLSTDAVTHWGAYTMLEEGTHNALTNMSTTEFKAYVDQMAALRGRTPVGSITAFKNDIKVGLAGENPWSFIEANGLKVVQDVV
jgi:hypothetical protein